MILVTRLSLSEWRKNDIAGRWLADCSLSWGHVWLCLFGVEVSITW